MPKHLRSLKARSFAVVGVLAMGAALIKRMWVERL